MRTRIYVEGGGDQRRTLQAFRAAFKKYFEKVAPERQPCIVACGSRRQAYKDFLKGLDDPRYDRVLLLVDAEDLVDPRHDAWSHLQNRAADGWRKPTNAANDSAHLMVQCMESWFMADKDALARYYGQGFRRSALPQRLDIENISKADVSNGLENATRHTQTKGKYHKTHHGFEILEAIDPAKVAAASPSCQRLNAAVRE